MNVLKRYFAYLRQASHDLGWICWRELRLTVRDQGVLIFFLLVPLAYPLVYAFIYTNEVVRDVPVAVVDDSRTSRSRLYVRHLDASPDVHVAAWCADMDEARQMMRRREAYGIVYLPENFNDELVRGRQACVKVFCDMSGLLYYKALLAANTYVSLDMNADIKMNYQPGLTEEQEKILTQPIAYEEVSLYNPQNGFAAFLIPAVLVLVIHQTLLLGIGLSAGTAREHNSYAELVPVNRHFNGLLRIVFGKGLAYLLVYVPVAVYVLGVVPRLFRLNHLGAPATLGAFAVPFLLATIFFAMTVSVAMRRRETCILLIVFTSVPLLFISGVSWPRSAVPTFWQAVSYLFPSTFGINGCIRINSMGATLPQVSFEWYGLWAQAVFYFLTTCVFYRAQIIASRRRLIAHYKAMKAAHTPFGGMQRDERTHSPSQP